MESDTDILRLGNKNSKADYHIYAYLYQLSLNYVTIYEKIRNLLYEISNYTLI